MSRTRPYLTLLGIAGVVVAADQWTKYLIRSRLALGEQWAPWEWLAPFGRVVHSDNTGAAFGLFQDGALFFTIVAVVVSVAIFIYFPRVPHTERALRIALPMQLGGAAGNLIDRLLHDGRVTDFISLGRFPVFNVADASISIGVAVLLLSTFFGGSGDAVESEEPPSRSEQPAS